jgi:hypothetical protein
MCAAGATLHCWGMHGGCKFPVFFWPPAVAELQKPNGRSICRRWGCGVTSNNSSHTRTSSVAKRRRRRRKRKRFFFFFSLLAAGLLYIH